MKTTIVISILAYAVLLSAVSTIPLTSLAHAAHAQTRGGRPTIVNPQGFNCQNPTQLPDGPPPIPSCASPLGVTLGGSHSCRVNPSFPLP